MKYHLLTRQQPIIFATHLLVTYTLTFLAFSSLIVCIARDPGPVNIEELHGNDAAGDEVGMSEALMADFDFSAPGMWCRKCWVCLIASASNSTFTEVGRRLNPREHIIVLPVDAVCLKWVR